MFPAQYKTRLHPADNDFFALVTKSYLRAFIEISSDKRIPLKPIFFLTIPEIIFLKKLKHFLSRFLNKVYGLS